MGMKTKGVAFNLDDPGQKELFEYASTMTNFSAYVKRLIQSEKDRKNHQTIKTSGGGISFKLD